MEKKKIVNNGPVKTNGVIPKKIVPAEMSNKYQKRMMDISATKTRGRFRESKDGARSYQLTDTETDRDFTVKYGWVTQTGFYPNKLDNQNQDNLYVRENFPNAPGDRSSKRNSASGHTNKLLLGVFDGHGLYGAHTSTYAVGQIEEKLLESEGYKNGDIGRGFTEAYPKISDELHKLRDGRDPTTDPLYCNDDRSGTTGICCFFNGGELTVANVGDSRAICGAAIEQHMDIQEEDMPKTPGGSKVEQEMVKAMPLSIDQTCFRADERRRCRDAGAVIMTIDQISGKKKFDPNNSDFGTEESAGDDPPRLWIKDRRDPGIAFTRSLGDTVSERYVGCVSEPEILTRRLSIYDRYIVIASDGVFEFLSSQAVINIVSKFHNPQEAARALVAEAYKLWLQYDVRTDDITAIVVFVKPTYAIDGQASPRIPRMHRLAMLKTIAGSFRDINTLNQLQREQRPVRRNMNYIKRLVEGQIEGYTPQDGSVSHRGRTTPKTAAERESLQRALEASFMFNHLNPEQVENIIDACQKVEVFKGETIIRQGDTGDLFFVVIKGTYDCFIADAEGNQRLVKSYQASTQDGLSGNPTFGELALVHGKPRAASVVATSAGQLWAIDYHTFQQNLNRNSNAALIKTLRKVPFFQRLGRNSLQNLADMCAEAHYHMGTEIIKEGAFSENEQLYILMEGKVLLTKKNKEQHMILSAVSFFGEYHILTGDVHDWTATAHSEKVVCLCIARQAFREIIRGGTLMLMKRESEAKVKKHLKNKEFTKHSRFPSLTSMIPESTTSEGATTNAQGKITNSKKKKGFFACCCG